MAKAPVPAPAKANRWLLCQLLVGVGILLCVIKLLFGALKTPGVFSSVTFLLVGLLWAAIRCRQWYGKAEQEALLQQHQVFAAEVDRAYWRSNQHEVERRQQRATRQPGESPRVEASPKVPPEVVDETLKKRKTKKKKSAQETFVVEDELEAELVEGVEDFLQHARLRNFLKQTTDDVRQSHKRQEEKKQNLEAARLESIEQKVAERHKAKDMKEMKETALAKEQEEAKGKPMKAKGAREIKDIGAPGTEKPQRQPRQPGQQQQTRPEQRRPQQLQSQHHQQQRPNKPIQPESTLPGLPPATQSVRDRARRVVGAEAQEGNLDVHESWTGEAKGTSGPRTGGARGRGRGSANPTWWEGGEPWSQESEVQEPSRTNGKGGSAWHADDWQAAAWSASWDGAEEGGSNWWGSGSGIRGRGTRKGGKSGNDSKGGGRGRGRSGEAAARVAADDEGDAEGGDHEDHAEDRPRPKRGEHTGRGGGSVPSAKPTFKWVEKSVAGPAEVVA